MCAYVPGGSGSVYMWMQYLQNSERAARPLELQSQVGCDCGCWELNPACLARTTLALNHRVILSANT